MGRDSKLGLEVFGGVGEEGRDDGLLEHGGRCDAEPDWVRHYPPEDGAHT